jgi:hypothetical protein
MPHREWRIDYYAHGVQSFQTFTALILKSRKYEGIQRHEQLANTLVQQLCRPGV